MLWIKTVTQCSLVTIGLISYTVQYMVSWGYCVLYDAYINYRELDLGMPLRVTAVKMVITVLLMKLWWPRLQHKGFMEIYRSATCSVLSSVKRPLYLRNAHHFLSESCLFWKETTLGQKVVGVSFYYRHLPILCCCCQPCYRHWSRRWRDECRCLMIISTIVYLSLASATARRKRSGTCLSSSDR